jgi:plastocyanin
MQRVKVAGLSVTLMIATACSGSSTGPVASPVVGGHSSTIVASGSSTPATGTYFFNPVPDTVTAGTAVTFEFHDVIHTVTFDQAPGVIGNIAGTANADSMRVFGVRGTYTYHCSIHPYMHGTVVVQ